MDTLLSGFARLVSKYNQSHGAVQGYVDVMEPPFSINGHEMAWCLRTKGGVQLEHLLVCQTYLRLEPEGYPNPDCCPEREAARYLQRLKLQLELFPKGVLGGHYSSTEYHDALVQGLYRYFQRLRTGKFVGAVNDHGTYVNELMEAMPSVDASYLTRAIATFVDARDDMVRHGNYISFRDREPVGDPLR